MLQTVVFFLYLLKDCPLAPVCIHCLVSCSKDDCLLDFVEQTVLVVEADEHSVVLQICMILFDVL